MQTSYPIPDVNALLTQLCLSISEVTGSTHTLRITLTLVAPFICQISDLCLFRTAKLRDSNYSAKSCLMSVSFNQLLARIMLLSSWLQARIVAARCTSGATLLMNRMNRLRGISGLADQRTEEPAACQRRKRKSGPEHEPRHGVNCDQKLAKTALFEFVRLITIKYREHPRVDSARQNGSVPTESETAPLRTITVRSLLQASPG